MVEKSESIRANEIDASLQELLSNILPKGSKETITSIELEKILGGKFSTKIKEATDK